MYYAYFTVKCILTLGYSYFEIKNKIKLNQKRLNAHKGSYTSDHFIWNLLN